MGKTVAAAFVNHPKVKELLDVKNYNLAVIQPRQLPNGVTYIGTIHEIGLDIYKYNEWYLDDWTNPAKPEDKPLVPENQLALLSSNNQLSTSCGTHNGAEETLRNLLAGLRFVHVSGTSFPSTVRKFPLGSSISVIAP